MTTGGLTPRSPQTRDEWGQVSALPEPAVAGERDDPQQWSERAVLERCTDIKTYKWRRYSI